MRWPGIEPGSTAWKAAMLTTIPPTLVKSKQRVKSIYMEDANSKYKNLLKWQIKHVFMFHCNIA